MKCPQCGSENNKVIDTRDKSSGEMRRRRRKCVCGFNYTTYETLAAPDGSGRYNNQNREPIPLDELLYRSDVLLALAYMLDGMRADGKRFSRSELRKRGGIIAQGMLKRRRRQQGIAVDPSKRGSGQQANSGEAA